MKKKIFKNSVLGISVLTGATGCNSDSGMETKDIGNDFILNGNSNTNVKTKAIAVPLSMDNKQYINAVKQLANDVFCYPELAKDFIKSPQTYFSRYGYEGEILLDDGIIKLIMAYANDDIRQAIQNNDLKLMVRLCSKNHLFDDAISKIGFKNKIAEILTRERGLNTEIQPYSWFWYAEWVFMALAYWQLNTLAATYTYTQLDTESIVAVRTDNTSLFNIRTLWNIVNEDKKVKYFVPEEIEQIINEVIEPLKEIRPELFNQFSEEEIRNQIRGAFYGTIL